MHLTLFKSKVELSSIEYKEEIQTENTMYLTLLYSRVEKQTKSNDSNLLCSTLRYTTST